MPNLTDIFDEETENLEIEIKLQHLKDFLEEKDDWQNITNYTILEYFPKETDDINTYVPNAYKLVNIKIACIENGVVIFTDAEGILEEQLYLGTPLSLQAFTVDSIIYIGFQTHERKITISMNSGYIQIYY